MKVQPSTDTYREYQRSWQAVEDLSDLLSEAVDLPGAARLALQFALQSVGRPAGVLFVQSAGEAEPLLVIQQELSGFWALQVNEPASLLREMALDVIRSGRAFTGAALESSPALDSLAAAVPLAVKSEIQGVLVIQGPVCSPVEMEWLVQLARPIARSLRSNRLYLAAQQHSQSVNHWELLRSRNTLRALFDGLPNPLYIVDCDYQLVTINASGAERAGKAPQALVNRLCYDALYGLDSPCPGCLVTATLRNSTRTHRTTRREGAQDEDPGEWEVSTYPILDENNQAVQAILVEQDVSERRRLENILAQSEKLAAVGQLAAGVAHDINNPLTAILANAQILQRELPPDHDLQDSVDLISRAGTRATQVVRNLLDFARKDQYRLTMTDVNETIQRALTLVQHELLARSIRLVFDPASNLPPVLGSQDHLQGVWLNLLMNAIDAIDKPEGLLRVTTRRTPSEILVSVADNGKGIPGERLARIFEPFYTTKAPGQGTGLGLSVCNQVIKQHGGHIRVDSQVGEGSEFTVVLPIS